MAYYNNTRKERELATDLEISNMRFMNKVQKDYDNGYIPQIMDTRTRFEKLNDKNFVNQQLTKLSYNLFNNDNEASEEFMTLFKHYRVDYKKFTVVYDALVNQFKDTSAEPLFVLQTAEKLMSNVIQSGTTGGFNSNTIMENLEQLKEELNNYTFNNKFEETEAKQKLDAMIYLYENVFNNESNITKNTTDKISLNQYKKIRNEMKYTINELIKTLVRDDIDETIKEQMILEILLKIQNDSITQITTLIQKGDIIIDDEKSS